MEETLRELGGILLRGIPTFILVVLLHFYLKFMFFKPLGNVLHKRYLATEGARKAAAESLQRAAARAAEYEAKIRAARSEVYQAQEQVHKRLQDQETAALTSARQNAENAIREAREQLAKEVEVAKAGLTSQSEQLASTIADSLVRSAA